MKRLAACVAMTVAAVCVATMAAAAPLADKSELIAHIVAHAFWKTGPNKEQVSNLVDKLHDQQADTILYVDQSFHSVMNTDRLANIQFRELERDGIVLHPTGINEPFIYLDLKKYAKRPPIEQLLGDIKDALDRAEFNVKK